MIFPRRSAEEAAAELERSVDFSTPDAVVMNADKMLYRAKKAGRNRVIF